MSRGFISSKMIFFLFMCLFSRSHFYIIFSIVNDDELMLNVLRCHLTYYGQVVTNAEARFNNSLRPRKPEGSLGWTAQDVHLDSHTAPELWSIVKPYGSTLSKGSLESLPGVCICIDLYFYQVICRWRYFVKMFLPIWNSIGIIFTIIKCK